MSSSVSLIQFTFEPAKENGADALLRMESSFKGSSELKDKEAEKVWKKLVDLANEFPERGPTIVGGIVGR